MARTKKSYTEPVIRYIKDHPQCSSQEILAGTGLDISIATLKRELQQLAAKKLITVTGKLKGARYSIDPGYNINRTIDVNDYFKKEVDERDIRASYDHALINEKLSAVSLFNTEDLQRLDALQHIFTGNVSKLSAAAFQKEMERLAIDLSWKSSQIEGNTYSLLETEILLKDKKTAEGKTKDEAVMLLNHKDAIDFIVANPGYLKPLTVAGIENIHSLLVKELGIDRNIRSRRVGISGTNYRPLDNAFQIKEALEDMCTLINRKNNVFEKALLALALISYIQPFADGNKRTSRIVSNAILVDHRYCPVSFRTVDAAEYKKAMLIFYEQHNISAFREIFINQFEFAVNTYF